MMVRGTVQLQTWGAQNEYGPYRVQPDGLPYFSDVFRDFLARNSLSVEQFAHLYGELAKSNGTPYTRGRIYQMIRDNSFPVDGKRRWILAKMLSIPPVLLGLNSLDELPGSSQPKETAGRLQPVIADNPKPNKTLFSPEEYHQTLNAYWKLHKASSLQAVISDIQSRIRSLEKGVLYGDQQIKEQSAPLLCGYHMLLANMKTDREAFNLALTHLNRAYSVAKEKRLDDLLTTILLRRGWVLMARGERSLQKHASAAAQESFSLAAGDYQAALDMSRRVHPAFQEVVMVSLGLVEAKMAHTPLEFAAAMKKLDQEDAIVGKTYDETGIHFIYTDEEQYHLDRAEAYLAAPVRIAQYPRDARRELRAAQAAITPPYPKRHQAFNLVLQAQS